MTHPDAPDQTSSQKAPLMDKLPAHTSDLTERNIKALAELFPAVVTESRDADGHVTRAVDFDLLRQQLSDHVVDGPQERYRLDWPGKREAMLAANAPIAKTLRPVREESVDFDTTKNLFIEADNLDALKLLQESYLGKVKLIYIDPPYNTGNDFIYDDDFAETSADYLARSGQIDESGARLVANTESNGRFHSDWLSMMYPRLKLARNLLRDDGFLCVSIDDGEPSSLKLILDEIYGMSNFAAKLIWKKGGTGKNDSRFAVTEHEYVLVYARDAELAKFGVDIEATVSTSYNREDERGEYSLVRLDSKTLGYVPSLDFGITDANGVEYWPNQPRGKSGVARWRWGKQKVDAEFSSLVFENGSVYTKNYKKEGVRPRSLMIDDRFGVTRTGRADAEKVFGESGIFDFPKPLGLLRHLIRITSSAESIVMDFFAGSSSTAHAVLDQNAADGSSRRFIMVQLDEAVDPKSEAGKAGYSNIAELSRERIRRAGRKIKDEAGLGGESLDVGFRTLKIDSTNKADVLRTPDETDQLALEDLETSVKPDRTGEDLLFQVLLDWGLRLDLPIVRERAEGQEVFVVDGGALIACLEENITPETIRAIAARTPLRAVFRDAGFATDADRINAEQIFREVSPATDVKTI